MAILSRILLTALSLAAILPSAFAQTDIRAPFGFFWGETAENVQKVLDGVGAKSLPIREAGDRQVLEATGLIRPGMKQALFYFKKDALVEMELQYQNADWSPARYEDLLTKTHDTFVKDFGAGKTVEEVSENEGVKQTVRGWEWSGFDTQLLLLLYRASQEERQFDSLSIHYRYAFAADFEEGKDGLGLTLEDMEPAPMPSGDLLSDPLPMDAADSEATGEKAPEESPTPTPPPGEKTEDTAAPAAEPSPAPSPTPSAEPTPSSDPAPMAEPTPAPAA